MPKSKHRKNHKQKVVARNERIAQEKRKRENFQREFIMNLIKQEQEKGLFENNLTLDGPIMDGPIMDGPIMDGPIMDGPIMDGPIMDIEPIQEVSTEESTEESN
jgi:hypothetical protein